MEGYLNYYFEYHFLYINGIQYIESRNIQGASLMKLVFQPDTDMADAMAKRLATSIARALHAAGHCAAIHHAFRCGQCSRRTTDVSRSESYTRPRFRIWL